MKYCTKCGKQIMDEAVICVHCGCKVEIITTTATNAEHNSSEPPKLPTLALTFSFLVPVVGLILGIIGCSTISDAAYKKTCTNAIIISIVTMVVCFIVFTLLESLYYFS